MYKKIVVPLDGSPLAEYALPFAVELANRTKSELLLLRVAELPTLIQDTPDNELEVINAAEKYLSEVYTLLTNPAQPFYVEPARIRTLAAYGKKSREISELAPFEGADLVIMTTHGRTGLRRLVMGSVATKVLRQAGLPVILIKPDHIEKHIPLVELMSKAPSFATEGELKVLVTLDSEAEHEVALGPAIELVKKIGATLHVLEVVVPLLPVEYGGLAKGYSFKPDGETQVRVERVREYLAKVEARLAAEGVKCVVATKIGDPPEQIVEYAKEIEASVLVMATHARGTVGRFFLGSVSEEVMRHAHLPVMMIPPQVYARIKAESAVTVGGVAL